MDYLAVSDNKTYRFCRWESYVLERDILIQKNNIEPQACKNISTIFKWQDSLEDFMINIIFIYMNSNNWTHFKNTLCNFIIKYKTGIEKINKFISSMQVNYK